MRPARVQARARKQGLRLARTGHRAAWSRVCVRMWACDASTARRGVCGQSFVYEGL